MPVKRQHKIWILPVVVEFLGQNFARNQLIQQHQGCANFPPNFWLASNMLLKNIQYARLKKKVFIA